MSLSKGKIMAKAFTIASPSSFNQLFCGRDEPILDPEIPIIDAHHHLFTRPSLRYLLDDYLADARAGHKIVATVYMEIHSFARPDGPELLRPLGEIEFANGLGAMCASGTYGDTRVCAGIISHADLRVGDQIGEFLDRALEIAPERFRGIRQVACDDQSESVYKWITNPPPRGLYKSQGFIPAIRQIVKRGLTFDAALFHHQISDVIELADTCPDATIVLNHCGHVMAMDMSANERAEIFQQYRKSMIELGRRPNVYCKIGGLGLPFWGFEFIERQDPVGYQELATVWRPYVETSIEAFGVNRCMMESNYPQDGRSAGFVPLWNALKFIVRSASPQDKATLFHGTAAKVYRIKVPGLN
jgi:predicted TIM-barrel fold metal-dependent hydrolase